MSATKSYALVVVPLALFYEFSIRKSSSSSSSKVLALGEVMNSPPSMFEFFFCAGFLKDPSFSMGLITLRSSMYMC
jgi:hypothetical protein